MSKAPAPEQIRAGISPARDGWYQNINMKCGMYEFDMTEYTRADIANARIAELEAAYGAMRRAMAEIVEVRTKNPNATVQRIISIAEKELINDTNSTVKPVPEFYNPTTGAK
jgi:hypothetical protein